TGCFMAGNRRRGGASRKSAAGGGGSDTRAALHRVARPMARRREAREARVAGECRRGGGAPRHRASEAQRDVFGANGGGVPSPESKPPPRVPGPPIPVPRHETSVRAMWGENRPSFAQLCGEQAQYAEGGPD